MVLGHVQQAGALAHNAKRTQYWCEANLPEFWPKEVWPPSSPGCNPLDYYVWSVFERDVNKAPHNTAASLIVKATEVMTTLLRATMALACKRFRRRIEPMRTLAAIFFYSMIS
jgi:hypothetical protein